LNFASIFRNEAEQPSPLTPPQFLSRATEVQMMRNHPKNSDSEVFQAPEFLTSLERFRLLIVEAAFLPQH
jgi:hypothetical protein